ncbi:MAG: hypothetical protein KF724_00515 [Phycisphaeraceae bacterium]|nr:hypothetical protein [Phycisphaeraceae bacterium]
MKKVLIAASTVLVAAAAANADVVVTIPGTHVLAGGQGVTVETTPLIGTLTGIIVKFNYSNAAGGSWAADIGATVGNLQWGGYDIFVNGANDYQGETGAPNSGSNVNFASAVLGLLSAAPSYNNTTAIVGVGNGYSFAGSSATLSDVEITLKGVDKIPAPGALALLGLAGVVGRRRRA